MAAVEVFNINNFVEKAFNLSKHVSPGDKKTYEKGFTLLRQAWTNKSVYNLKHKGKELSDMLPASPNTKRKDIIKDIKDVKQALISLHERMEVLKIKSRPVSSRGRRPSQSSLSQGSIQSDNPKLPGKGKTSATPSSEQASVKSGESGSMNTKGTTALMHERPDKKDTARPMKTVKENGDAQEIEDDLEVFLKTMESNLILNQINYRRINYSDKETRTQRCRARIAQIECMFNGVIAAFDDLGLRLQKKRDDEGRTNGEFNKEISQLKGQIKTKENQLQTIFTWIDATDVFVNTDGLSGEKKFRDVLKRLPKEFPDAPLKLTEKLIDVHANSTKLKKIEEWIGVITRYAENINDGRPSFRGETCYAVQYRIMDDLLDQIDALKFHRKKSHVLEEWIDTLGIGAEDGANKVPRFKCPTELQEECSKIKKTLESVSQIHTSSKEFEDELEKLEAEIKNWSEQFKITGNKCKTQSGNRIRQCRNLISSRKADKYDSNEKNSDLGQEIRALAKDIENWEDVEKLQKIGKDTSTYLRDLRNVRTFILRKKQDDLRIIQSFREEIISFENELKHWSDISEVKQKEGVDSEICVSLRRVRDKTFKRKKQTYLISENMRIAGDELKQLKLEVSKWDQLQTVNNLPNPKDFPLALDVNEIRIAIVDIKKLHQGNIHSFETKMKEFKTLCNYIMDDEVKPKRGKRTSPEEPEPQACLSYVRRWKEDRQITQQFVEDILSLLQSSLIRLKSEPYSFHEPKGRKDVKHYSEFFADLQLCVYQLVDCIEFNAKRFATLYIGFSKAVPLLGEHYFALTSEQYPLPRKETPYENIIQNITDRLVQQGITKQKIAELVEEKNSLALRLSKAAGAKLRENNPNIADLSDPNRPTKISERYSELYDNQWTNAFEKLTDGKRSTEKRAIDFLLEIFKEAFVFCTEISNTQEHLLKSTILCPVQDQKSSHIGANDQRLSSEHAVMISELRKGTVDTSITDLQKHFKKKHADFADSKTEIFTDECVRLCWMMCVQTPPLWVDFQTKSDDSFNKNVYKSYTATGPKVDYVVWPALYLHHGGGLLLKGVAQGKASRK